MIVWRLALIGVLAGMIGFAPPSFAREPTPPPDVGRAASSERILVLIPLPPPHFRGRSEYAGSYGDQLGRSARRRLALRIAHEEGLTLVEAWAMPVVGLDCFIMRLPPGRSAPEVATRISSHGGVAWAEPLAEYRLLGSGAGSADPLFQVQPAARLWGLAELHRLATGRNVRIAVIDSMVDDRHPDLLGQVLARENLVLGRPSTGEDHGTAVAGIIAARAGDGQGIAGVAPGARVIALRACWQASAAPKPAPAACDTLSLARALVSALSYRAAVINLSLSGPPAPLLGRLLDVAAGRGVVVVAAFDRRLPAGGFPASHPGVVAVADTPLAGRRGVYAAPGRGIPTSLAGGGWGLVDGSSYAAAHVSGLFALMKERRPQGAGPLTLIPRGQTAEIDACASLAGRGEPCACSCAQAKLAATAR